MKNALIAAVAAATLTGCAQAPAATVGDAATQAMLDRIAIEDMVVGYYAHLGGDDAGSFDDYFTQDAIFDVNGTIANGRAEIEALYAALAEAEDGTEADDGTASAPFHMLLSNPVITVDGDTATAQFIWTAISNPDIAGPPVLLEQGREYDRLVRVDGQWLFAHRVVIAESGLPEGRYDNWSPRLDFSFDAATD